jgi:hypothetical protein
MPFLSCLELKNKKLRKNNMGELKILGHIDLPEKKIRPEEYRNLLEKKMSDISLEVNEQFSCEFLDDKGSILMSGETAEADQKFVDDLEND